MVKLNTNRCIDCKTGYSKEMNMIMSIFS